MTSGVLELIDRMASGAVDVIAFTSSPQVARLFDAAKRNQREAALRSGSSSDHDRRRRSRGRRRDAAPRV